MSRLLLVIIGSIIFVKATDWQVFRLGPHGLYYEKSRPDRAPGMAEVGPLAAHPCPKRNGPGPALGGGDLN